MGDLDCDTRLEGSAGCYRARVSEAWEGAAPGRPASGLLAALALRAAGDSSGLPRPVGFTVSFTGRPRFGEVEIGVSTLSSGDRTAALRVSMTQSEAPVLEGLVWTAAGELPGYAVEFAPIPEYPGPEGLPSVNEIAADAGRPLPPSWSGVDYRSRSGDPSASDLSGRPAAISWHRFRPDPSFSDPYVDAGRILFLSEATAMAPLLAFGGTCPAELPYVTGCLGLAASLHRDARKAEWLMLEGRVPAACGGIAHGEQRFWSPDGTLLATVQTTLLCHPNAPAPELRA
jgi:acyl-CoA thioesterase